MLWQRGAAFRLFHGSMGGVFRFLSGAVPGHDLRQNPGARQFPRSTEAFFKTGMTVSKTDRGRFQNRNGRFQHRPRPLSKSGVPVLKTAVLFWKRTPPVPPRQVDSSKCQVPGASTTARSTRLSECQYLDLDEALILQHISVLDQLKPQNYPLPFFNRTGCLSCRGAKD